MEEGWRAVRERAGVFGAPFRAWVRVVGEDRANFLQGMLTNDVRRLALGEGAYAAFLTQQGRVVSDLRVYCMADGFLLDFPASSASAAQARLERFVVADDVEFVPLEDWLVAAEGPRAGAVLQRVGISPPPGRFGASCVPWGGHSLRVVGASHTGENGWLLGGPPDVAEALREALVRAGAEPVGTDAIEALRIEAGIPWIGIDMDDSTLVLEAELEGAIGFGKGCYLGQEVVERVAARGHVNRYRRGLVAESGPLAPGWRLSAGSREVGRITSAAWSPHLQKFVAMGYVWRECAEPGTELAVRDEGGARGIARVAALPLYSGARRTA